MPSVLRYRDVAHWQVSGNDPERRRGSACWSDADRQGPAGRVEPRASATRSPPRSSTATVTIAPKNDTKHSRAMWGTTRALINNMVTGVVDRLFRSISRSTGVGYRAQVQGGTLNLQLGYSHDIPFPIPDDVRITCERPTVITVSGADRQRGRARSPPRSALTGRPSPTRAKASNTQPRRFAARKARRSNARCRKNPEALFLRRRQRVRA